MKNCLQIRADPRRVKDLPVHATSANVIAYITLLGVCAQFSFWSMCYIPPASAFLLAGAGMALNHVLFSLCVAELTSAIPFSGGSYGYARCAMGLIPGFVAGLAETQKYLFALVGVMLLLRELTISVSWGVTVGVMCAVMVVCLAANILGGKWMWKGSVVAAVVVVVLWLISILSLFPGLSLSPRPDLSVHVPAHSSLKTAAMSIPALHWLMFGCEATVLLSEETINPRKTVAWALVWMPAVLVALTALTLLAVFGVTSSSVIASSPLPIFTALHGLYPSLSRGLLTALYIIILITHTFGILFAFGRQVFSLARAGLFPKSLAGIARYGTPHIIFVIGGCVSVVVAIVMSAPFDDNRLAVMVAINVSVLGALVAAITTLSSYIALKLRYPNIQRKFLAPFGVWGAGLCLLTHLTVFVAFLAQGEEMKVSVSVAGGWLALGLLYHFAYARRHMVLSPEELFAIHSRVTAAKMLRSGVGFAYLKSYCLNEHAELINCWKEVAEALEYPSQLSGDLDRIYRTYIRTTGGAVSVAPEMAGEIDVAITTKTTDDHVLQLLRRLTRNLEKRLETEVMPEFKKDPKFVRYLAQEPIMFKHANSPGLGTRNSAGINPQDSRTRSQSHSLPNDHKGAIIALHATKNSTRESFRKGSLPRAEERRASNAGLIANGGQAEIAGHNNNNNNNTNNNQPQIGGRLTVSERGSGSFVVDGATRPRQSSPSSRTHQSRLISRETSSRNSSPVKAPHPGLGLLNTSGSTVTTTLMDNLSSGSDPPTHHSSSSHSNSNNGSPHHPSNSRGSPRVSGTERGNFSQANMMIGNAKTITPRSLRFPTVTDMVASSMGALMDPRVGRSGSTLSDGPGSRSERSDSGAGSPGLNRSQTEPNFTGTGTGTGTGSPVVGIILSPPSSPPPLRLSDPEPSISVSVDSSVDSALNVS